MVNVGLIAAGSTRAAEGASAHQPEPRRADIERKHRGVGYVEALDFAGQIEPRHHAAGFARQLPQALTLSAEHQRQWLPQRDRGKILAARTVEPDRQEAAFVQ